MRVIRAEVMGMCFGVRDALTALAGIDRPREATILGELVHNRGVLDGLAARGFRQVSESERDAIPDTPDVVVTAHGISDAERHRLESAGKRLIDTTCPLVRRVHRAARALHDRGYFVLVVGRSGHVEVRGIVGDLDRFEVVETADDVRAYDSDRLGVVCQSTVPPRTAAAVREAIERLNPTAEVRVMNTICDPTRDRQAALERLIAGVEAVVVVGGRNSNNSRELAASCRAAGRPAHLVERPDDLDPAWFSGVSTVGLAAGTSTPDAAIDAVHAALCRIGGGAR